MGLDNINTKLALANLYLNDRVSVTFDDSDRGEGSSSTPIDIEMVEEEEDEEETTDEFVDSGMEEDEDC